MRKKRFPITLVCAIMVVLVVVGGLVLQWVLPGPAIEVSRDTTYLTTPLAADGLPDYGAYFLAKQRAGVTPENNGAIPFLQAMWPAGLDAEEQRLVCKELGMALPERPGLDDTWSDKQLKADLNAWYQARLSEIAKEGEHTPLEIDEYDGISYADDLTDAPWTRDQIPPMAEWLDRHAEFFDLLHEAARRGKFYLPSPDLLNPTTDSLDSLASFHSIQILRNASRQLSIRAMLHLGEGNVAKAWEDVRTIYTTAEFSPSDTFVSHLVSIAIEGVAHADTFEVLQHPDLDRELAQAILDYLQQLSPRDSLGSMIQGQERIFLINFVLHFSGHGPGEADPPRGDDEDLIDLGVLARGSIDWNVPLRQLNDWCDRVAQACALPDRASQHAALMTLQQETEVLGEDTVGKTFGAFFSPQARSQLAADKTLGLLAPALSSMKDAEERANAQLALHTTAAALAVYRLEKGEYPDTLSSLVPDILPAVPEDLFTTQPLLYRRTKDGYLLYSAGPNGTDDGGSRHDSQVYQGYRINSPEDEQAARKVLGLTPLPEPPETPDLFAEVTPPANPADVPLAEQIPAGADDISLRVPLLRPEVPLRQP